MSKARYKKWDAESKYVALEIREIEDCDKWELIKRHSPTQVSAIFLTTKELHSLKLAIDLTEHIVNLGKKNAD